MSSDEERGRIAERYQVVRELGRGATGRVVLARDLVAEREVAIKLLSAEPFAERAGPRLRREGQLLASLRHAGVVAVHSVGEWQGRPFLVMDYVEGARQLGELPRSERLPLLLEAARTLAHVHARGLVHRDLKPANLLVDAQGRARVCDFGLAWSAEAQRLTQTGRLAGTPLYMAPEQFQGAREGQRFDPRTDVWALGVILYEALTGQVPFARPSLVEQMAEVLASEPAPPRSLEPGVSPALEAVCLKALRKRPEERFAHAGEFADALAAALAAGHRARAPWWLPIPAVLALLALGAWVGGARVPARQPAGSPTREVERAAEAAGSPTPAPTVLAARLRAAPASRRRALAWAWLEAHPRHPEAEEARAFLRAGGDAPLWRLRTQAGRSPLGVVFRGPRSLVTFSARAAWAWSLAEEEVRRAKVAHGRIGGVVPLSDGRLVLLRSTGEVKRVSCYQARGGEWERAWIKGSPRAFTHLAAAARGGLLAYAFLDVPRRRLVWLLEPEGGERRARLGGLSPGPVRGLALAPGGERAYLLEGSRLSQWELGDLDAVAELSEPRRSVEVPAQAHSLALTPRGDLLALDHSEGARLYDPETLEPRRRLGQAPSGARALPERSGTLAFDEAGEVLARVAGRSLELWAVRTGAALRPVIELPALARGVSVSPDGALVAAGLADGSCWVWPVRAP